MRLGMELEASHSLENENQFWDELDRVLRAHCNSHAAIDNVLRAYLELTTKYRDDFLRSGHDLSRCSERLLGSELFSENTDYIRLQIIHSLLQEDDPCALLVIVSLLLVDGHRDEIAFELMNSEGAFVRLLELILSLRGNTGDDGAGLQRMLMDLFYEMSRIQRIKIEDLVVVDDDFVKFLLGIIEEASDVDDPYHYPVIRVLLVLNEQFMVAAHDPVSERPTFVPPTNKVIKALSMYGSVYKTFGENIILLLNRENETSLQLLTLKLLYLLFTTPPTYEYFYTNDLRVLVDILIRNLLDLPEEASALRHTYLRVLYPLLAHTQLKYPPHYKRDELRRLLGILIRDHIAGYEDEYEKILHFDEVDETTKRLVLRCAQVDWLIEPEERPLKTSTPSLDSSNDVQETQLESEVENKEHEPCLPSSQAVRASLTTGLIRRSSSESLTLLDPAQVEQTGLDLEKSRSSVVSMTEMATQREKPGVMMPRKSSASQTLPKQKPEPPKARGWRGRRGQEDEELKEADVRTETPRLREKRSVIRRTASESEPHTPHLSTATCETEPPTVTVTKPRAHSSLHPPAVPPPRRSSHSVPPPIPSDLHPHSSTPRTPRSPPSHQYHHSHPKAQFSSRISEHGQSHAQKPEPPKTRRWRAHLHATHEKSSRCTTPRSVDDPVSSCESLRGSPHSSVSGLGEDDHSALAGIAELEKKISAIQLGEA